MSDLELAEAAVPTSSANSAHVPLSAGIWLALINLLWAASAIAVKLAIGSPGGTSHGKIGPFTMGCARFALAVPFLLAVLRARRIPLGVRREDYRGFVVIGVVGLAVTYAIFYSGIRWTTATESTLLVATEPILIALMARVLLGEPFRRGQAMGLALGFCGVYLIVYQGLVPRFSASVAGNALIAAALCFESYASVVGKGLTARYRGLVVLTIEFCIGAAVLLPLMVWELVTTRPGLPGPHELLAIGYMVLVCSFFCYAVWFQLLARLPVSAMAGFLFIQPVMGPVYGWLFLHERLRFWTAVGAALVVAGVWLVALNREPKTGPVRAAAGG